MEGALAQSDDGVERFRCVECARVMPVVYRANIHPYGFDGPICVMCASYWDHLAALDEREDEEEDD